MFGQLGAKLKDFLAHCCLCCKRKEEQEEADNVGRYQNKKSSSLYDDRKFSAVSHISMSSAHESQLNQIRNMQPQPAECLAAEALDIAACRYTHDQQLVTIRNEKKVFADATSIEQSNNLPPNKLYIDKVLLKRFRSRSASTSESIQSTMETLTRRSRTDASPVRPDTVDSSSIRSRSRSRSSSIDGNKSNKSLNNSIESLSWNDLSESIQPRQRINANDPEFKRFSSFSHASHIDEIESEIKSRRIDES